MRPSSNLWSEYFERRFSTRTTSRIRRANRRPPTARRRGLFESLEGRTVLSATFGSALSIGNDAGSSIALGIAADSAGNSYVTGYFAGTVDFDLSAVHAGDSDILTARGPQDAYVAKYAPDNSLIWARRMGGDASSPGGNAGNISDAGQKIAVNGGGNMYVVGKFVGAGDFGSTTLSTPGDHDGFVAKLDPRGTVQWAKSWGTTATDRGLGVGVDSTGNVYALGSRLGDDYDILKFSSTGGALWTKSIESNTPFTTADLAVSASGSVFVAGSFQGTVDFDPSSKTYNVSSGPSYAAFALKLGSDGKFGWVSPFVGRTVGSTSGHSAAQSVALDGSGNVIVGGLYADSVDFNPGSGVTTLPTNGHNFVTKLNSSGGLTWAQAVEGFATVAVDAAGSVYATGGFTGTVDLDPGAGASMHTSAGGSDIAVVKLTSAGAFSWGYAIGGTGSDGAGGIAVDATGVVHVAGYYQGTVDFDSDPLATYNLTNPGPFNNGFRLRLRQV